nr:sporamin B [Ipomoea batatas]GME20517.1 sporamin B [Ipomoea batatas]
MKIHLTFFFSLSLSILAAAAAAAFDPIRLPTAGYPVVDINGNDLFAGSEYYMSADVSGQARGQGVGLEKLNSTAQCPNDVVQFRMSDLGDPVVFTPAEKDNFVVPSTFQAISFTAAALDFYNATEECADKVTWNVEHDDQFGLQLVKAGEAVENVSNSFKIELVEWSLKAYKLTYCPRYEDNCYNVGRYYDRATRTMRLALTNTTATLIVFKKK